MGKSAETRVNAAIATGAREVIAAADADKLFRWNKSKDSRATCRVGVHSLSDNVLHIPIATLLGVDCFPRDNSPNLFSLSGLLSTSRNRAPINTRRTFGEAAGFRKPASLGFFFPGKNVAGFESQRGRGRRGWTPRSGCRKRRSSCEEAMNGSIILRDSDKSRSA